MGATSLRMQPLCLQRFTAPIVIYMVYYVQISFVRLAYASPEALSVVQQPPPSAFFTIDILSYTFLGISTVFLAFSMDEASRILKGLLFLNGFLALVGFLVPLMPFVYKPASENDTTFHVILIGWCLPFIAICVLLCLRFRRMLDADGAANSSNESKRAPGERDALLGGRTK